MILLRRERLVAEIDADLKKRLNSDSRSIRQVTEVALRKELGDHRESVLDVRIEHKDRQISLVESEIEKRRQQFEREIRDLNRELEDIRAEKAELVAEKEDVVDGLESPDELYEQGCRNLLTQLENGEIRRLVPTLCEDIAETHSKKPVDVWENCRRIAAEEELSLYNTQFMTPQEESTVDIRDRKPIADAWEDDQ